MSESILKKEEKISLELRALYKKYGYLPYKMSKFESYDLYASNKDFLVGDGVITFNDTDGKLLALKPDVTLSIIKNTVDEEGCKQKVYYNENVYRVSSGTHQFKEIMQTGLECIGDIDVFDIFEVVYLAAKSLDTISSDFVLDISHIGVFSTVLDEASDNKLFKKEAARLVSEKNSHELHRLCDKYQISPDKEKRIEAFVGIYGNMGEVISRLSEICITDAERAALSEFTVLCELLSATEFSDKIRVDFSVINNMAYYNGVVFKGFLNGICESVLSGGCYDPLMRRIGRKSSAIGFAIYVDLLENFEASSESFDVDVLLLYSENTDSARILKAKNTIVSEGKSVSSQRCIPAKLRYKTLIDLDKEEI